MKLKLADIINNVEAIKTLQTQSFPVKVSYKLKRLSDKLDPIIKSYEEKRTSAVMSYGEPQEDGSTKVTEPEKTKDFLATLNELLEIEEEIDFEPISIGELGDQKISPKEMISWVFTE